MSELWLQLQTNVIVFVMVTVRVSGIFTFNPIFARRGVPNFVKAGATIALAFVMFSAGDFEYYKVPSGLFPVVFDIMKELLVGLVLGFVVNLLLQVFSMAGEVVEMQLGLSMAKSYDPTFGNSGIITQYYSLWFMLYFFTAGAHKSYIQLFAYSYDSIPMGYSTINVSVFSLLVKYFETVLTLGLKLAMPIIAASLITEFCVGVMMKAVPTIHVFVLNIQLKMLVGFTVLAASCSVVSEFMEKIMGILFESLHGVAEMMTL